MTVRNLPKITALKQSGNEVEKVFFTLDNYRTIWAVIGDNTGSIHIDVKAKKGGDGAEHSVPFSYKTVGSDEFIHIPDGGLTVGVGAEPTLVFIHADSLAQEEYDRIAFEISVEADTTIGTVYAFLDQPRYT